MIREYQIPEYLIIEEQRRRSQQDELAGIPLHAPSPVPPATWDNERRQEPEQPAGSRVIIIDLSSIA